MSEYSERVERIENGTASVKDALDFVVHTAYQVDGASSEFFALLDKAVGVLEDDQLREAIDLAMSALVDAAGDRRSEDEQFDISRAEAAENERIADAYMAAFEYLRAVFGLDTEDDNE